MSSTPSFFKQGGGASGSGGGGSPFAERGSKRPFSTPEHKSEPTKPIDVDLRCKVDSKFIEVKHMFEEGNPNEQALRNSLTNLMRKDYIQLHGTHIDIKKTIKNPTYEAGFKGWNCINKEGTGFIVPFDEIGDLAKQWVADPVNGLQVLADKKPPAIRLKMEIAHSVLNVMQYDNVDEFKQAIDALPNPATYLAPGLVAQTNQHEFETQTISAVDMLFRRIDRIERHLGLPTFNDGPPAPSE